MGYAAHQAFRMARLPLLVLVCLAVFSDPAVAESAVLADTGAQIIRDCSGKDMVLSGSNDKFFLTSGCRSLTIFGDANEIFADMAAGLEIGLRGNNNKLAWTKSTSAADPTVIDARQANGVLRFRPETKNNGLQGGAEPPLAPQVQNDAAQAVGTKSAESAKRAATSKSMQEIKKDLGMKDGAMGGEMAEIPSEVMFEFNSDQLLPGAVDILAECAEMIKRDGAKDMRVIGHTDSMGPATYNLKLSKRRAEAVVTWLVKQGGIPSEDLVAIGLGPKKPKASNATVEGRKKNRRVEVVMPMGGSPHKPQPSKM